MDQTKADDGFKRAMEKLSRMAVRKATGKVVVEVHVSQGGVGKVTIAEEESL